MVELEHSDAERNAPQKALHCSKIYISREGKKYKKNTTTWPLKKR